MRDVLIVEDHPIVARAMTEYVQGWSGDFRSEVCGTADEVRLRLATRGSDWYRIFLDLAIPGAYGLSMAREVQNVGLHRLTCIVSASGEPRLIAEARSAGFLGYVVKASPHESLARAIADVLEGRPSFPASDGVCPSPAVRLTRRQAQFLDGVRRGRSSKEIAARQHVSEGTVNNVIMAAMRALDVASRSHAVARALELGLLDLAALEDGGRDALNHLDRWEPPLATVHTTSRRS